MSVWHLRRPPTERTRPGDLTFEPCFTKTPRSMPSQVTRGRTARAHGHRWSGCFWMRMRGRPRGHARRGEALSQPIRSSRASCGNRNGNPPTVETPKQATRHLAVGVCSRGGWRVGCSRSGVVGGAKRSSKRHARLAPTRVSVRAPTIANSGRAFARERASDREHPTRQPFRQHEQPRQHRTRRVAAAGGVTSVFRSVPYIRVMRPSLLIWRAMVRSPLETVTAMESSSMRSKAMRTLLSNGVSSS